jgi:hypothetical protein
MDLSSILSVAEGAVHLAIDVPVLGLGVVIGAVGAYYVIKKYPTIAASLVSKASTEVQALVQAELTKVATAKAAAANIAQTTASTNSTTGSK